MHIATAVTNGSSGNACDFTLLTHFSCHFSCTLPRAVLTALENRDLQRENTVWALPALLSQGVLPLHICSVRCDSRVLSWCLPPPGFLPGWGMGEVRLPKKSGKTAFLVGLQVSLEGQVAVVSSQSIPMLSNLLCAVTWAWAVDQITLTQLQMRMVTQPF